jgi:hypothetical protein
MIAFIKLLIRSQTGPDCWTRPGPVLLASVAGSGGCGDWFDPRLGMVLELG